MITVDFRRLNIAPGDRILDIGCGNGRHVAALARRRNVFVCGADRCGEDLIGCRDRMAVENRTAPVEGRWGLIRADLLNLPFDDHTFDLVVCAEVLEHIKDHRKAAAELSRVLKPGKSLVVSVPRFFPERFCWALSESYRSASGGHVRIYREVELCRLLVGRGFRLWGRGYAHALHTPYWWLKCLAGPDSDKASPVALYHRLLVWDMMKKPWITQTLERLLNPVLGKSVVFYLRKEQT
ncbi:MAG: methyltransferase domain-containing protein [Desulfobacterales bacterium]|nr:methyltransferase domain-containing protein [Desulfobacterales bacterium]